MSGFGEQFSASRRTNLTIRALDASVRSQVASAFDEWESGQLSGPQLRRKLEGLVRNSYRSAAAVGLAHLAGQAGIPRWKPGLLRTDTLSSAYLSGLVSDVRRNLDAYRKSDHGSSARLRAVSRISHSAGVAASRGHTDALILAADELVSEYGFLIRKVWRANFVDHTPCEWCSALDGSEAEIHDEFVSDNKLKVYGDLKGPPRHPRCMCWLVMLIVGLENYDASVEDDGSTLSRETMSTDEVKAVPHGVFSRIVMWLRSLVQRLRRERV